MAENDSKLRIRDSLSYDRQKQRDVLQSHKDDSLANDYILKIRKNNTENLEAYTMLLTASNMKTFQAQERIAKLVKDSINSDKPEFGVFSPAINSQSIHFNEAKDSIIGIIPFENTGNCSVKATVKLYLVIEDIYGQLLRVPGRLFLFNDKAFPKESQWDYEVRILAPYGSQKIYFFVSGHYNSSLNTLSSVSMEDIMMWNFKTNRWDFPTVWENDRVMEVLKQTGIDN